jgi:hypothetical protein
MQFSELRFGDMGELLKSRVPGTREGSFRGGSDSGWQEVGSAIGHCCPHYRFGS